MSEREEIGRQCKRLIDAGRLWYLESHDLNARLAFYVNSNVSLENTVLLATSENLTLSKDKIDYIEIRFSKYMSEGNNNVTFLRVTQAHWLWLNCPLERPGWMPPFGSPSAEGTGI